MLLFKLGYVERDDLGVKIAEGNVLNIASCYIYDSLWTSVASSLNFVPKADVIEPRATVKVCVLGDNRVGKSSFVWRLSGLKVPGSDEVEKGVENVKKADSVVIGGFCKKRSNRTAAFATASSAVAEKGSDVLHAAPTTVKHLKGKYYLSISSVPLEVSQTWIARNIVSCDLVVLMFECGHVESLETVLELEKLLPPNIPRIFLASKSDLLPVSRSVASAVGNAEDDITRRHEIVLQKITLHLQEEGLLPVQMLSSTTGDGICSTVASIASIMEDPETAIPVKHRRQQTTSSWLSTKSVAVVAAAVGIMAMTLIIRYNKDLKAWIKDLMHSNKGRKIVSPMNFNVSNYFLSEFQSHKRIETI